MYLVDFEYDGQLLSDFGYTVCHITSDSDIDTQSVGCDITFNTVINRSSSVHKLISTSYDSVYQVSFEIMKNPCEFDTYEDIQISNDDIRKVIKWLNRKQYLKFVPIIKDNFDDVYYYGSFNISQIIHNSVCIGLSLEFTSNAPFGFGGEVIQNASVTAQSESFSVYVESDEIGTLYPTVEVTCNSNGTLKLSSDETNTTTEVKNCVSGEILTFDCENKIITTSEDTHTTLPNDFNYVWLGLVNSLYPSENTITASIPCDVTIKYSPVRKVAIC